VKIKTNIQRRAEQSKGLDESADPAAPFTLSETDERPPGLPAGTYWLNSGQYGFYSKDVNSGLRGGPRATTRFEIVYLHETPGGKILPQQGGYADPDSSWGWDGRFELQPKEGGGTELVITQGAMELPTKHEGVRPGGPEMPLIKWHNFSRNRHVFKPLKFENGKLYALDQGSILDMKPVDPLGQEGDWVAYDPATKQLKHAHGYGENFIPDPGDPRRIWKDEYGYPIRIFDMVVEQTNLQMLDGSIHKVPSATRAIAFRMDPKNPSKRVASGTKLPNGEPADLGIVIMSEENPTDPSTPLPSTIRMEDLGRAKNVERRTVNPDNTVTVLIDPPVKSATLIEGFNPVPGIVTLPSGKKYYLGTFSASEYTAGAKPETGEKLWRYGSYLSFRAASDGPLGKYVPVTRITSKGLDLADVLEDFTELYALSWGAGRPQIYQDDDGRWWADVHAVDTDLLRKGIPKAGYPQSARVFADEYRRLKISVPIRWTEKEGQPWFEIDDPAVNAAIEDYRRSRP
jgi:hypothetical protein